MKRNQKKIKTAYRALFYCYYIVFKYNLVYVLYAGVVCCKYKSVSQVNYLKKAIQAITNDYF